MSRADRVLIAILACVALGATPAALALSRSAAADTVFIESPAGVSRMSLTVDAALTVAGAEGSLLVESRGGAVRICEADCRDHTCVRTGWVRTSGATIVCLPNGVTVRIGGERDDGLDAVVR